MEIQGKIKLIGETQSVGSNGFRKRELVVTTEEQYPQHLSIDFVQDKTDLLNNFQIGQLVKVGINLRGREWISPQGETKHFNSIQGWRIDSLQQNNLSAAAVPPMETFEQAVDLKSDEPDDLPFLNYIFINMANLNHSDFKNFAGSKEFKAILKSKLDVKKYQKILKSHEYQIELLKLQTELVDLQQWVAKHKKRVCIIFEGRDAAGKGGAIRRFTEHMNPRSMRVVALTKPTESEKGQWYFRRYIKELPEPGEIVFFDRSWYNRAVVEPVMGFCTENQYNKYMVQVPEFEHMLYEDGVVIIKFWFSISKEEQLKRFNSRLANPLKQWKFSPVDKEGQKRWDLYTTYKEQMFSKTHTSFSPWIIIKTNNKKEARLESIRYVLSQFEYSRKDSSKNTTLPDPNVAQRYHRLIKQID